MHPFVCVMQRYIEDYCNHQDTTVCREIMAPHYVVHIGGRHLEGRDERYVPAAASAFAAFPDLRLTVHELHTNGDRLVMRFSERGTSGITGRVAAWGGIGLYDWDGERLVSNWVEQDYAARRRQVEGDSGPDPLDVAHPDPWAVAAMPADATTEQVARRFLLAGDLAAAPRVVVDDSWISGVVAVPLRPDRVEIDDLFSAGPVAAAHLRLADGPSALNVAAILRVEGGEVTSVRAVTDRSAMEERRRR